jgi:hypothetical protein
LSPARAADDLPVVGEIEMPRVRMPQVDVDVRVGAPPPRVYPRDAYAAMPPARYERDLADNPAVPPYEVARMLRSTGYSLLGQVNRRGWVYTVAVLDPRGEDGRVVIDARTGAIIRFVHALDVGVRFNDELTTIYGPPGPPPVASVNYENRRGSLLDLRRSPRPPVNVPKVASRTPSATTQPAAKPAAPPAQTASVQQKTPEAAKPAETKPAEAAPAQLDMKPTQDMPAVQALE